MANDPSERRRRGRAARQSVCRRFSWTTIAQQLSVVLDEVVDGIDRGSPRAPSLV